MEEPEIGWLKISRKIWNWRLAPCKRGRPFTEFEAWLWLLTRANWEPVEFQGERIDRGELVVSTRNLAEKFRWSHKRVRYFLENLERHGEVTMRCSNKFTVIKINNYERYQSGNDEDKQNWGTDWGTVWGTVWGTDWGTQKGTDEDNISSLVDADIQGTENEERGTEKGTQKGTVWGTDWGTVWGTIKEYKEYKNKRIKEGENIPDTCIVNPSQPDTPTPTSPRPQEKNPQVSVAGWEPTDQTRDDVTELLHRLEGVFGMWPFTQMQRGSGEEAAIKEELAAILRLLSVEEVVDIVKREMEKRSAETKGADRPRNLKWYMKPIKDAFYERDRRLEEEERRRDEEKRNRSSGGETTSSGGIMFQVVDEILEEAEPTQEDRERILKIIRQTRERLKGASDG